MQVLARFANKDEKLEGKGYEKIPSEMGAVYLPVDGLSYSDTITLGFAKFLWMPQITVSGVSA